MFTLEHLYHTDTHKTHHNNQVKDQNKQHLMNSSSILVEQDPKLFWLSEKNIVQTARIKTDKKQKEVKKKVKEKERIKESAKKIRKNEEN